MDLNEYQQQAAIFDQVTRGADYLIVPLLGLAGETGELLSEYKRNLRAQEAHSRFPDVESAPDEAFPSVAKEELGDILWYAASVATKVGLSLEEIAEYNLKKLSDRYQTEGSRVSFFDERYPEYEQIPRNFEVLFVPLDDARHRVVAIRSDGKTLGDKLTDNSHVDDGYRYHDVFHFSYATMLGWSPVTRKFMRVKRGSNPIVDEVEDGGRSWIFEESIALLTFDYARRNKFFKNRPAIDGRLLRDIKNLTVGIEVHSRSRREWELAIQEGYAMWHELRTHEGGWINCDLNHRKMTFRRSNEADVKAMLAKAASFEFNTANKMR